ncbi:5-oxoprolinase subunit PxpA [Desulfatiferula olefinivorans]
MIRINCDIGERGTDHPVDRSLIDHIHIANIACGGHAGDPDSASAFSALARSRGVDVAAHLSYPDRANFGRVSMNLAPAALISALDEQRALLPEADLVKFHGGLYNDSCVHKDLADRLGHWLAENGIRRVLAPARSAMARAALDRGIGVLAEAFAERRYRLCPVSRQLTLLDRTHGKALIDDCDEAVAQALAMIREGRVRALIDDSDGDERWASVAIRCETLCVHSDSSIALTLARRLAELDVDGFHVHA